MRYAYRRLLIHDFAVVYVHCDAIEFSKEHLVSTSWCKRVAGKFSSSFAKNSETSTTRFRTCFLSTCNTIFSAQLLADLGA